MTSPKSGVSPVGHEDFPVWIRGIGFWCRLLVMEVCTTPFIHEWCWGSWWSLSPGGETSVQEHRFMMARAMVGTTQQVLYKKRQYHEPETVSKQKIPRCSEGYKATRDTKKIYSQCWDLKVLPLMSVMRWTRLVFCVSNPNKSFRYGWQSHILKTRSLLFSSLLHDNGPSPKKLSHMSHTPFASLCRN